MELTLEQQIFASFAKATKILIALPEQAHPDLFGSALALRLFLQKLEKEAVVVTSGKVPPSLSFLPGFSDIRSSLNTTASLVVVLDTTKKELDELSYQEENGSVNIYLKPKNGEYIPADVSFRQEKSPADTIVVLGARSLEDLGQLFEQNPESFYEAPKINIDNHPGNEYFGAINVVDINTSSVAETLAALFEKFESNLVDEDIATCLLTGIITKTHSFQHVQTTPHAFLAASQLVAAGGRQQEVVKHLYKTKSLPLLRLWGRALARLKILDECSCMYSMINLGDFGKAGADDSDAAEVLHEILENAASYRVVGLMTEILGGGVRILLALHNQVNGEDLLARLKAQGVQPKPANGAYRLYDFTPEGITFLEAEQLFTSSVEGLNLPKE